MPLAPLPARALAVTGAAAGHAVDYDHVAYVLGAVVMHINNVLKSLGPYDDLLSAARRLIVSRKRPIHANQVS